jgi:hypothetical protein
VQQAGPTFGRQRAEVALGTFLALQRQCVHNLMPTRWHKASAIELKEKGVQESRVRKPHARRGAQEGSKPTVGGQSGELV